MVFVIIMVSYYVWVTLDLSPAFCHVSGRSQFCHVSGRNPFCHVSGRSQFCHVSGRNPVVV